MARSKKKDDVKSEVKQAEQPAAVSDTGRAPDAPDGTDAPMIYDERGDAHALPTDPDTGYAVDPLLAPESQQPGESAEHYAQRRKG